MQIPSVAACLTAKSRVVVRRALMPAASWVRLLIVNITLQGRKLEAVFQVFAASTGDGTSGRYRYHRVVTFWS